MHAQPQAPIPPAPALSEMIVTARKIPEHERNVPVAITTLSAERLRNYNVRSLEQVGEITPSLIITRGNSGSGADFRLRGIGSAFSSIGIEQSVAVVVDGVYYGQGRIIDEGFLDVERIEILKGPQALFFGKNSSAGVISITTADPSRDFETKGQLGYEFVSESPLAEFVISGPVSDTLGLRLVVAGQYMFGGYVRNDAVPGTYTTFDAATGIATPHFVPAPRERDLPAERSLLGRFTATYEPADDFDVRLKISANRNEQGGTSWNDRLWKCPSGVATFPGSVGEICGEGFHISQNPAPPDIAATRRDMRREGGALYALYESYAVTAEINKIFPGVTLTSIANYQHFDYASNSDYDFTSVPAIWADQANSYRAFSGELRARTRFESALNFLVGLYYQSTTLSFTQSPLFFGSENSLASGSDRYVSFRKDSATDGETFAAYGQAIWNFQPRWEFTAGARYLRETKKSWFVQPYVSPFFAVLYAENHRLDADQSFNDVTPEVTLTWKPTDATTLYAAYRTGYKSGGFSNSAADIIGSAGVDNLTFEPETARGAELGIKTMVADRAVRLNANVYHYRFQDLQVEFFNAQNFALISNNAGAAVSEGVELEAQYLPTALPGASLHGSVHYNEARYRRFIGPCYAGQTQAQGCNIIGPPPDRAALQDLSGKPTLDSPKWTGTIGANYERSFGKDLMLGGSADVRFSSHYSASAFAQPLDVQSSYVTVNAAVRLGSSDGRWQTALIGRNLTNRFIVTYAADSPSTGTVPGGTTGEHADQFALFAPARSVQLQFIYRPP